MARAVTSCTTGAALLALSVLGAAGTPTGQEVLPRFRVAIDLIPVDVQVTDKNGQPVAGLTADRFEVTINGRRRKVVSADLVDYRLSGPVAAPAVVDPPTEASARPSATAGASPPGRVFIIAVDANSFDETQARPVLETASAFIELLGRDDEVGLFAFPHGPTVNPTTDHDAVTQALAKVVARYDGPPAGEFKLGASEIVELSTGRIFNMLDLASDPSPAGELARHLCPPDDLGDSFLSCLGRLGNEVRGNVLVYESNAELTGANLRGLMAALGQSSLRKTLVLLSGGLLSSNEIGGRPDTRQIGIDIGRAAAEANVSVYALFVDGGRNRAMSAATGRVPWKFNPGVESGLQSRWLDDFAGSSGGSLLRISAGNGEPAFGQVLRETSAFYLLGVEPGAEDRDGRTHEMTVKVRGVSATVRARSWVFVPRPGAPTRDLVRRRPPPQPTPGPAPGPAAPAPTAAPPPSPLPPPPPEVAALADAFMRNDRAAIARDLAPRNANFILEAFRTHASPWPDAPRRTAIFALDLAAEGLGASSPFTAQEALRLLAEYMVRVRQPGPDRSFECTWLWAASAALEGQFAPEISTVLVERAAARCPDDPNLRLAQAVVRDQELLTIVGSAAPADRPAAISAPEARVLELYRLAAEHPDTHVEAVVRSAYVHARSGRAPEALALLDTVPPTPQDQRLLYLHHLIRGQVLVALGRLDEAATAFRTATVVLPAAPSAMVGLMTTTVAAGRETEASALAERVLATDRRMLDPWWVFPLGDYAAYDVIRARLRGLAE